MKRQQLNGYTQRWVRYTWKNSIFSREKLIYSFEQQKPTWTFESFIELAQAVGFRKNDGVENITLSQDRLWVILRKVLE